MKKFVDLWIGYEGISGKDYQRVYDKIKAQSKVGYHYVQ